MDNSAASTGSSRNPYACEDTSDKVFLISYKEVTNPDYGFASSGGSYDTARRKTVSDYARATGAAMSKNSPYYGNGWWWLRSPYGSYGDSSARGVYYDGYADNYGSYDDVNYVRYGVVPALQIRLN